MTAYMQRRYEDGLTAFRNVAAVDANGAHVGEEYFAGMCLAIPYFETVLASDYSIPDPLMTKYGVAGAMEVGVTAVVPVTLPMSNLAVALILAEAYQRTGERTKAIELLESLGATAPGEPVFALALSDLYAEGNEWDDVAEGVSKNEDDVTLNVLAYRAAALSELGIPKALSS